MMIVGRTLSAGAECTGRYFVTELTSLLAAELLALFAVEKTLVLVHVFFFLAHASDVGKHAVGRVVFGRRTGTALTHLVEKACDAFLGVRVGVI